MTHPVLDRPEVLRVLFHPRHDNSMIAPGAVAIAVEVEPKVTIGGRLYPGAPDSPVLLFFHGNGEIAAHYDYVAGFFVQLGITLLVMDYRAYGVSNGTPTGSNLLTDAVTVFKALGKILESHELSPTRLHVMGRSLGSAAAIEVARHAGTQLAGLIVESGFADTFPLLARLGLPLEGASEERHGFGNALKMSHITTKTLIIHGERDELIPATQGKKLYDCCAATDKALVVIPGAGHNTVMRLGKSRYFAAIQKLVSA